MSSLLPSMSDTACLMPWRLRPVVVPTTDLVFAGRPRDQGEPHIGGRRRSCQLVRAGPRPWAACRTLSPRMAAARPKSPALGPLPKQLSRPPGSTWPTCGRLKDASGSDEVLFVKMIELYPRLGQPTSLVDARPELRLGGAGMIARAEILGGWRLVSYEVRAIDATVIDYPFGEDADGFLVYTDDGYMSAQLMRRHRALYDHPWGVGGMTEHSAAAARGYLAYSGSFDVDEDRGTVRHHVSVSLYPNWVGGDQVRYADLADGHLVLVAGVDDQFGPGRAPPLPGDVPIERRSPPAVAAYEERVDSPCRRL